MHPGQRARRRSMGLIAPQGGGRLITPAPRLARWRRHPQHDANTHTHTRDSPLVSLIVFLHTFARLTRRPFFFWKKKTSSLALPFEKTADPAY
jgi:hypothetical protein